MRRGKAAAICLPLILAGLAGYAVLTGDAARSQRQPRPRTAEAAAVAPSQAWPGACAEPQRRELGVVSPVRALTGYPASTGISPNIAEFYVTFGSPFWAGAFNAAESIGAVPLMQWNPESPGVASIAAGGEDAYLRRFAAAVRAYGCPVILSFGHEMNGNWFPWGYQHTSPAVFVAAWRRVVDIFASQGASNVIWLWTVNAQPPGNHDVSPLAQWWPGAAYVSWVGVDGYYRTPGATFESLFGSTLPQIRELAPGAPVLVTETAVDVKAPRALAQLTDLFSSVSSQHLRGLVWFDIKAEEDWALEDNSAVLAAFRSAAAAWLSGS